MGLADIFYDGAKDKWKEIKQLAARAPFYLVSLGPRTKQKHARQSYGNTLLIEHLEQKYSKYDFLTYNNERFPITVFEYQDGLVDYESTQLNSVLERDFTYASPDIQIEDPQYYYWLRSRAGRRNNDTFVLDTLALTPKPKLKCKVSDFFSVAKSSLPLEWEILNAVSEVRKRKLTCKDISLFTPLRNKLHSVTDDPVIDGNGRAAAIGISTLLAHHTKSGVELFLRARGKRSTPPRGLMYHVLPAAFFQAPFKSHAREYSLVHNCLWEYYEEFFNKEEKETGDATAFYKEKPVESLRNMLQNGKAELHVTGVAVDLMTLRPEILQLLYIKDQTWYDSIRNEIQISPEHILGKKLPTGKSAEIIIPFTKFANVNDIFSYYNLTTGLVDTQGNEVANAIVPQGAAALALGANKLFSILDT